MGISMELPKVMINGMEPIAAISIPLFLEGTSLSHPLINLSALSVLPVI
jgi:hypothetical protein